MWLKRCCAMAAIVLLLFSVSLQPSYADESDYTGADMFLYFAYPTRDPVMYSTPYPVPCYRSSAFDYSLTPNLDLTVRVGVQSSSFPELTKPLTIYYAYEGTVQKDTTYDRPGFAGVVTQTGVAENIHSTSAGTIQQTIVNNTVFGSYVRQIVCRTTLPVGTVRFSFSSNSSTGVGFTLKKSGSYFFSFGYAYIVATDDESVLSKIDEIIKILGEMNVELDTQTEILKAISKYVNDIAMTTDDIAQNVAGIYDLLKNALKAESEELSQNAEQVGDQILQQTDGEQYWKDKNTENFDALDISNFSFESGVVTALSAVGRWFAGLWESLGPVTIIFTFPLTLGIALVVVGRVARSAGKGSKSDKGGSDDD